MFEHLLSVSIPSFNMADQTIAAVRSADRRGDVQIVAVADGSGAGGESGEEMGSSCTLDKELVERNEQ